VTTAARRIAGWRVREVAAHLSMGFRYSLPKMAWELVKAGGGVNRMADRRARLDAAAMSTAELAGAIRDNARHPWRPPVGGIAAALGHDVVHGLDISVALGLGRRVPGERVRVLLDQVGRPSRCASSARSSTACGCAPTTSTGRTARASR